MGAVNMHRVRIGALWGGVVFFVWSMLAEFGGGSFVVGKTRMDIAMNAGWFLKVPRVPAWLFFVVWILCGFLIAWGLAWLYANVRATAGPGPKTAALLGLIVGFIAGFPMEFAHAAFQPLTARYAIVWCLEMVIGCILAALTAGKLYKDAPTAG
jgi:signal transduction histidine kinase